MIGLPSHAFAVAFPFHFVLDEKMQFVQLGRSLAKLLSSTAVGSAFYQHLVFEKPTHISSFESLKSSENVLFIISLRKNGMKLRGQMVHLEKENVIFFLGSAWINDTPSLLNYGLSVNDFALHDPIADLITVIETQKNSLSDIRQLAAKTAEQRTQLREAHKQLSIHYASLQKAEALTRGILTSAVEAILSIDDKGFIRLFNPAAERLFGYSAAEILGQKVNILMPRVEASQHDGHLYNYLHSHEPNVIGKIRHIQCKRKDGTFFPAELSVSETIVDNTHLFCGFIRDISPRLRYEEALRKKDQLLECVTDCLNYVLSTPRLEDSIDYVLDSLGKSVDVERVYIFENRIEDGTGRYLMDLRYEKVLKGALSFIADTRLRNLPYESVSYQWLKVLSSNEPVKGCIRDVTGSEKLWLESQHIFSFLLVPIQVESKFWGFIGFDDHNERAWSDIEIAILTATADSIGSVIVRHRAEERLRIVESAINNAAESVIITDSQLNYPGPHIIFANRAFEKMSRYSIAEVLGKSPRILQGPKTDRELRKKLRQNLEHGQSFSAETINYRKDGTEYLVEWQIAPVFDKSHNVTHWISVQRDITEKRQAEEELVQARKTAEIATKSKSEFLANMSHEIRTPMNGILGMSGILLKSNLDPQQRDFAETIHNCANSLLNILNDVLDFSKIEAGKLNIEKVNFDLRSLIEDTADIVASQGQSKGLEIITIIEPNIPCSLYADVNRLRQILLNLIGNAVKFTHQGEVVIHAHKMRETQTTVTIQMEVIDTGIGIKSEDQSRLFQAFSQVESSSSRRFGGTGLGLAISKQLIELMGGQIGVKSQYGSGSTFWFRFEAEKQVVPGTFLFMPNDRLQKIKICVLEPHPTTRKVLKQYIENQSAQFYEFTSGQELVLFLQDESQLRSMIDVILINNNLPDCDSIDLIKKIRTLPSSPERICLMVPMNYLIDHRKMEQCGITDYLTKPIRQRRLNEIITGSVVKESTTRTVYGNDNINKTASKTKSGETATPHFPLKIFLVEDDSINQKVALAQLKTLGLTATCAVNGKEALDKLNTETFDIIFLDCQMPVMDGYQTAQEIRRREMLSGIPQSRRAYIVALTANATLEAQTDCLATGMDVFITKPIRVNALSDVLHQRARMLTELRDSEPEMAVSATKNSVLSQLGTLINDLSPLAVSELINDFLQEMPEKITELRRLFIAKDGVGFARQAHSIKGNSSIYGAEQMASICQQLEQYGKEGAWDLTPPCLQELESEYILISNLMKNYQSTLTHDS